MILLWMSFPVIRSRLDRLDHFLLTVNLFSQWFDSKNRFLDRPWSNEENFHVDSRGMNTEEHDEIEQDEVD